MMGKQGRKNDMIGINTKLLMNLIRNNRKDMMVQSLVEEVIEFAQSYNEERDSYSWAQFKASIVIAQNVLGKCVMYDYETMSSESDYPLIGRLYIANLTFKLWNGKFYQSE